MDQQILALYNDNILQQAMRRYGISEGRIKPLDAVENLIYEFRSPEGADFILRIGHSLRKSEALLQGEVHWINHLARGGVSVARAITSQNGNLIETIVDGHGGNFLVTAFVKASGQSPWEAGWTPARYEAYGQLIGKTHALAVGYQPDVTSKRPEWDDANMKFVELYLPAAETLIHQKYKSLLNHIYSLPKDKNSYGLIHQDAHQNNFFMDVDDSITLFDFDDCAYSWFINDIAIVLFYISFDAQELGYPTVASFTQMFMSHFLRGYREVYTLNPLWLKEIPTFLKLRELELYAVTYRDFDIQDIDHWRLESFMGSRGFDAHNEEHMWIANFMRDRKMRIEQGLPFIDFDFESLA